MTKPKLLLFNTDLKRGGTPTVVRELAVRLRGRGHNVEVGCLDTLGEIGEELRSVGVTVHPLNARGSAALRIVPRFADLVRQNHYTHVLSFLLHANAVSGIASLVLKHTQFFQSIQTTQPNPAWHWRVQRLIARRARKIIVPSTSVAQAAQDRSHVAPAQLVVIPNGIDADAYAGLIRPQDGLTRDGITRVGFLGRLDPVKRVQDLIATAPLLKDRGSFEIHIFGDGPERQRLESLANTTAGVLVRFHGSVPSAQTALAEMDLLVLPSEAEGFGLVLIEAMAAGIPVVASDAPGIRDVAIHEHNALLYPTGNVACLSECIIRITQDVALRDSLTLAGKATITQKYTFPPILAAYEQVLGL